MNTMNAGKITYLRTLIQNQEYLITWDMSVSLEIYKKLQPKSVSI